MLAVAAIAGMVLFAVAASRLQTWRWEHDYWTPAHHALAWLSTHRKQP